MEIAVLQDRINVIPKTCYEELYDFMNFLIYKNIEQTGLDVALGEVERGETEHYKTFNDFKVAMKK